MTMQTRLRLWAGAGPLIGFIAGALFMMSRNATLRDMRAEQPETTNSRAVPQVAAVATPPPAATTAPPKPLDDHAKIQPLLKRWKEVPQRDGKALAPILGSAEMGALDEASFLQVMTQIERDIGDQPALQARISSKRGEQYHMKYDKGEQAQEHYQKALDWLVIADAEMQIDRLAALQGLSGAYGNQHQSQRAFETTLLSLDLAYESTQYRWRQLERGRMLHESFMRLWCDQALYAHHNRPLTWKDDLYVSPSFRPRIEQARGNREGFFVGYLAHYEWHVLRWCDTFLKHNPEDAPETPEDAELRPHVTAVREYLRKRPVF